MREIKFMVWDKVSKEIYSPRDMVDFYDGVPYFADCSDLIPMQFTGRKDKNGKEIYSGFIVQVTDETTELIAEVKYDNDSGAYKLVNSDGESYMMHYDSEEIEILGNIYENPELMNKKQK